MVQLSWKRFRKKNISEYDCWVPSLNPRIIRWLSPWLQKSFRISNIMYLPPVSFDTLFTVKNQAPLFTKKVAIWYQKYLHFRDITENVARNSEVQRQNAIGSTSRLNRIFAACCTWIMILSISLQILEGFHQRYILEYDRQVHTQHLKRAMKQFDMVSENSLR